jgi:ribonuclease HI
MESNQRPIKFISKIKKVKSNKNKKPYNKTIFPVEHVKPIKHYEYVGYYDGACYPNPYGHMGVGAVIYKDGEIIDTCSIYVPKSRKTSNNVAEYMGLQWLLMWFLENGFQNESILIKGDSMLVKNQMNQYWRIGEGLYVEYALSCFDLIKNFSDLTIEWIPREQNEYADMLSRQELELAVGDLSDWDWNDKSKNRKL